RKEPVLERHAGSWFHRDDSHLSKTLEPSPEEKFKIEQLPIHHLRGVVFETLPGVPGSRVLRIQRIQHHELRPDGTHDFYVGVEFPLEIANDLERRLALRI